MADEANHRDVNHTFAMMSNNDPNPFIEKHRENAGKFIWLLLIYVSVYINSPRRIMVHSFCMFDVLLCMYITIALAWRLEETGIPAWETNSSVAVDVQPNTNTAANTETVANTKN